MRKNKIIFLFFLFVILAISCYLLYGFGLFSYGSVPVDTSSIDFEDIDVSKYFYDRVLTTNNAYLVTNNYKYTKVDDGTHLKLDYVMGDFFHVKDTDYYIYYDNVIQDTSFENDRYKRYNELGLSITTKDSYYLYQNEKYNYLTDYSNDKRIHISKPSSYNVLFKDDTKYYVIFNDSLFYILDSDISEVRTYNTSDDSASKVAVLNYHFFYDKTYQSCNQIICLERNRFEEHLKYFKDDNFLTLTMYEYYLWINGELNIPSKSVLITIDDGWLASDHLIELLEKYDLNASLFLVTYVWPVELYKSPNLELYSHGHDLHVDNYCSKGSIGQCLSYDKLYADIKTSFDIVNSNLAFCFPFYKYNQNMFNVLKDLGVKLAFVGGDKKSTRDNNKYLIPRYIVHSWDTKKEIMKMVN